jgi:integrase
MSLVEEWLNKVAARGTGSTGTRDKYRRVFNAFLRATGYTPETLLEAARRDPEQVEKTLEKLIVEAEKKGRARMTAVYPYAVVRSFLRAQKVVLTEKFPRYWVTNERPPVGKPEIRRLVEYADPRLKAFICVMKDSGLAPVDVLSLKYGDVRKDLESNRVPVTLRLLRHKEKIHFISFLGPDAVEYLKNYIEARRMGTRRVPPENLTDESPLFRDSWRLKPIGYRGILQQFEKTVKTCGLGEMDVYDLRRFFRSALMGANLNDTFIEFLMGHKLPAQKRAYILSHLDEYKALYMNAYPALSLRESVDLERLRKQQLLDTARLLGLNAELLEKIRSALEYRSFDEIVETLQNSLKYEAKYCGEEELPSLIAEGWEVVAQVGGRILVKRAPLRIES